MKCPPPLFPPVTDDREEDSVEFVEPATKLEDSDEEKSEDAISEDDSRELVCDEIMEEIHELEEESDRELTLWEDVSAHDESTDVDSEVTEEKEDGEDEVDHEESCEEIELFNVDVSEDDTACVEESEEDERQSGMRASWSTCQSAAETAPEKQKRDAARRR